MMSDHYEKMECSRCKIQVPVNVPHSCFSAPPRPPEGKHSPDSEWCCSCLDEMNAKLVAALEELVTTQGTGIPLAAALHKAKALLREAAK